MVDKTDLYGLFKPSTNQGVKPKPLPPPRAAAKPLPRRFTSAPELDLKQNFTISEGQKPANQSTQPQETVLDFDAHEKNASSTPIPLWLIKGEQPPGPPSIPAKSMNTEDRNSWSWAGLQYVDNARDILLASKPPKLAYRSINGDPQILSAEIDDWINRCQATFDYLDNPEDSTKPERLATTAEFLELIGYHARNVSQNLSQDEEASIKLGVYVIDRYNKLLEDLKKTTTMPCTTMTAEVRGGIVDVMVAASRFFHAMAEGNPLPPVVERKSKLKP